MEDLSEEEIEILKKINEDAVFEAFEKMFENFPTMKRMFKNVPQYFCEPIN